MSTPHQCPTCSGEKTKDGKDCPTCDATGVVWEPDEATTDDHLDLTYTP